MVGNILRAEREKQGLTVMDIANETSIRAQYIEAIEKGDASRLPSEVYVKGFIRNYAEMLHLDGEKLAREYYEEVHGEEEPAPKSVPPIADASRGPFSSGSDFHERVENSHRTQNILIVALVIVVAFVGSIYYFFGEGGALGPKTETAQNSGTYKPQTSTNQNTNTNTQNNNTAGKPNNAPNTVNSGKPGNNANGVAGAANQPPQGNAIGSSTASAAPAGAVQVAAKFTGRCWLQVVSDGKVVYEGTVESGKNMTWSGNERISMTAGNAGAVEVTYNGKNMGKLGKEGDVIEKRFTKDKAEDVK